jgi:hypothetical protein
MNDDEKFHQLVEEISRRSLPEYSVEVGQSYVQSFGSVDDVLLFFEWVDLYNQIDRRDNDAQNGLADEFIRRAKGPEFETIIRNHMLRA